MDLQKLTSEAGISTKEISKRLCIGLRTVQNYINGSQSVPEPIQKLIRYEFAEFLPEEERLATVSNGKTTVENESVKELRQQNEELKGAAQELVYAKKEIELLKRNIELLEDQVRMYKTMVPGENKSKTA